MNLQSKIDKLFRGGYPISADVSGMHCVASGNGFRKPLSAALVRKIVKTRISENDVKCAARLRKARKPSSR